MASTDPWLTLGRSFQHCLAVCTDPGNSLFVSGGHAFLILDLRGLAGSPYIRALAVEAGLRGQGVGSRLLAFAEDFCRPRAAHLFLCVSSFNTGARALYERSGFEAVGEFRDYIIPGASEILMMKRLRPTSTPR